ncbi:MAG: nucleotidyltransferase family protein [Nanoarchaeota archaeon]
MDLTTEQKRKIKKVLRKHNIKKASIFGSYARGEANNNSDIDILVEPAQKSLFELVAIKQDLEDELELKIDINTFNGLNYTERKGLKDEVLEEQVEII